LPLQEDRKADKSQEKVIDILVNVSPKKFCLEAFKIIFTVSVVVFTVYTIYRKFICGRRF
jgi:hypothetical protein